MVEHVWRTDTRNDAVDSLEMVARFLEEAADDPRRWKWVMIALYTAVQGFMVLALRGTWPVATYKPAVRKQKLKAHHEVLKAVESKDKARIDAAHKRESELINKNDLDSFLNLYARIKDHDGWAMKQWGNDTYLQDDPCCDECMEWLKYLRDDFLHFSDGGRAHWLPRFALVADEALGVIDFLMHQTRLIHWMPWEDCEDRAEAALTRARFAVAKHRSAHPFMASDGPCIANAAENDVDPCRAPSIEP